MRKALAVISTLTVLLTLPGLGVGRAEAAVPFGFPFGPPAYDSGWVTFSGDQCVDLQHNLGGETDDYVVDLVSRWTASGDTHYGFGGIYYDTPGGTVSEGFYWKNLTPTSITVCSHEGEMLRTRIWVVPQAEYDSGWVTPSQDDTTLQHDLGGDADDYWVYLEFDGGTDEGINQHRYGTSAYWTGLDTRSITVHRSSYAPNVSRFRVRIWRMPTPAYDSGWITIDAGVSSLLSHDLGGPWNDFWVDLQFQQDDGSRHHTTYGGNCFYDPLEDECWGAYWSGLTGSRVRIVNRNEGSLTARIRIWASREPKYDSGWRDIASDREISLDHNLGGDPDAYVVDVMGQHPDWGINQIAYGGDTLSSSGGFLHIGVAWYSLDDASLRVYRLPDDEGASQVRTRLWIAPFPDYDSGWRAIGQNEALTLQHNLGGSPDDYVVVLDFKDSDLKGINQFWYGGDLLYEASGLVRRGAYWYGLDEEYIYVHRGDKDVDADEVRVRIWRNPGADYQSDWYDVPTCSDFRHGLGQPPGAMVVNLQFRDGSGLLHHFGYGRDLYKPDGSTLWIIGAYWTRFTSSSIRVCRGKDDSAIQAARVRVWMVRPYRVYLPLMLRND